MYFASWAVRLFLSGGAEAVASDLGLNWPLGMWQLEARLFLAFKNFTEIRTFFILFLPRVIFIVHVPKYRACL
jgi:hypothetical protein